MVAVTVGEGGVGREDRKKMGISEERRVGGGRRKKWVKGRKKESMGGVRGEEVESRIQERYKSGRGWRGEEINDSKTLPLSL